MQRIILLVSLLLSVCGAAFAGDRRVETGTYVTRVVGHEKGRETFRFLPNGLHVVTSISLSPATWWNASGSLIDDDGIQRWSLESESRHGSVDVKAVLGTGQVEFYSGAKATVASGAIVFPYELNLFSGFIVAGTELVERARKRRLQRGAILCAVVAREAAVRQVELLSFTSATATFDRGPERVWFFALRFEDGTEFDLLCDDAGLPLRIASTSGGLEAILSGFEAAPPVKTRSTAVDDGPWKRLLSPAIHEVAEETGVMVPMRDGVRLATNVYYPTSGGRYPTILVRTPYFRISESATRSMFYVPRGYAVVVQDVRGRGASEGDFDPLLHEMDDGSDTLDWIASQPWSDGNVGMIGASYVAWVQWFAAKSGNPHLKALVPMVCPPDPDENFPYEGGVLMLPVVWWAAVLDNMDDDGILAGLPDFDPDEVLRVLPLSKIDDAVETARAFVDDWIRHGPDDLEYWEPRRFQTHFSRMDVAALHISGWFDDDQPGTYMNFQGMRRLAATDAARNSQFMIMGPWGHGLNLVRRLGPVDLGDEAIINLDAICLRFFDRYLKEIENGIDRENPVLLFSVGDNEWIRTSDWPPAGSRCARFFLGSDGTLTLEPRIQGGASESFVYDPNDPRPVLLDYNDITAQLAMADHSKVPDRLDVLDYTSAPLTEPMRILGKVGTQLTVSTDAADTDFVVEVMRLLPSGELRRICGGIQRLRFHRGASIDSPVPPGEVTTLHVDCWSAGYRLEAGDRIRVQVSSSWFPMMARNLNTLDHPFDATKTVVATNTIHYHGEGISYLSLPVR